MTKLIVMKETADLLPKEEFERLLTIGEIKQDEKGAPYLVVDVDKYLNSVKDE